MRNPILYDSQEQFFTSLGLGVLQPLSCVVTESLDNLFYLNMTISMESPLFDKIQTDNIIKADAGHASFSKEQRFRIKRVVKDMEERTAEVYAEHVSYLTQDLAMQPQFGFSGTGQFALSGWNSQIIGDTPFTVDSNVTIDRSISTDIQEVANARQVLGLIKKEWNGEYIFNNYHISLLNRRGVNSPTILAYGRNLQSLTQEQNISNTVTSIYPFAVYGDDDNRQIITIPSLIVHSEYVDKFPNPRVLKVDFSREFERDEMPTAVRLIELAEEYIEANEIGIPKVSLELSFVDLTQDVNYQGPRSFEEINLGDTVPVYFTEMGITSHARVSRVHWNVLMERYDLLEIGDIRQTIGDRINNIQGSVDRHETEINNSIVNAVTGNTTHFGPDEPIPPHRVGDLWFRNVTMDIQHIYRWNGTVWELLVSTEFDPQIQEEMDRLAEALERLDEALESLDFEGLQQQLDESRQEVNEALAEINEALESVPNLDEINRIDDLLAEAQRDIDESLATANEALDQALEGEIHGNRIIANTIVGNRIVANAITTNHMNFNSINGDRITVNTLNADRIVANSIQAGQIATNAIIARHITAGTIQSQHIVSGSINSDHITVNTLNGNRIAVGTLHGDRIIANSIEGNRIVANSIQAGQIATNAIQARHISAGAITADIITSGTINAANVNIINLNVANLVGNITQFVQTNWNSVAGQVQIDGGGLQLSIGGVRRANIHGEGFTLFNPSGIRLAQFAFSWNPAIPDNNGASLVAESNGRISINARMGATGDNSFSRLRVFGESGNVNAWGNWTFFRPSGEAQPNDITVHQDNTFRTRWLGVTGFVQSPRTQLVSFGGGTGVALYNPNSTSGIRLNENGQFQVRDLGFDYRVPRIWRGNFTSAIPTANIPISFTIVFNNTGDSGAVTFPGVPRVIVTPTTSVPGTTVLGIGVTNVTATGCTVWITRTNTTNTGFNIVAIWN